MLALAATQAIAAPLPHALRSCLRVGIVGAHGYLGRELVAQALDAGMTPLPFVRRMDPLRYPPTTGWLDPPRESILSDFEDMPLYSTNATNLPPMDGIVFAMSGRPFEADTSTSVVARFCSHLPPQCEKVCLVSAWGVGDSIESSNLGIRAMRSWYLKSAYAEKERQEEIVSNLSVPVLILRPKVLSFSPIPFNPSSTPRRVLASEILNWIAE